MDWIVQSCILSSINAERKENNDLRREINCFVGATRLLNFLNWYVFEVVASSTKNKTKIKKLEQKHTRT